MISRQNRFSIIALMILPAILLTVPQALGTTQSSTFSWKVSCQSTVPGISGSAIARWNWTVNGVSVSGSWAACGWNNPGTGTVPANANGIIASLHTQIKYCTHTTSTTKSFTPGTVPSISLESSCQAAAYRVPVSIKASFVLG